LGCNLSKIEGAPGGNYASESEGKVIGKNMQRKQGIPSTTVIGSYPVFIPEALLTQHAAFADEVEDPIESSIQQSVRDFLSAGIEYPSTGQTRDSFIRIFLDPKYVSGIEKHGSETIVTGKISRLDPIRLKDVRVAKDTIPAYYGLKEPVTDPYTLARNCRMQGSTYDNLKDLTYAIAREIVRPELESIQEYVDYLQLDAPYFSVEPFKDYIVDLYEELLSGLKVPIVLHVCGDSFNVFKELTKLKVQVISLDFTNSDRLPEEISLRSFDQQIGLGCVSTSSPIIESVRTIAELIKKVSAKIGEDRVRFIHPACGERGLPLESAYQKNVNLTLARNLVYLGDPLPAHSVSLEESEYDPNGYFLIQVDNQEQQILVSFNSYDHRPIIRLQSTSGEKLISAIVDHKLISDTEYGKRHLGYVGYEIGKAETALRNKLPYRQDRPLSLPGVYS
jgi:5-methyltetrahydropteroyltriglutamate--homocysteine methyltransferase